MSREPFGLRATERGAAFDFKVVPGASRCGLATDSEGGLRVRVDAPPVEGAANKRLIHFLAKRVFHLPPRDVCLVRGERGRSKTVEVSLSVEQVRSAIQRALG